MLNEAARAAIDAGRLGHLTTLKADGSPQTTLIWVGMDGDYLVIASLDDRAKLRNIRRDPRVNLSIEADGITHGLPNYLVVSGSAEVVEGGASDWLQHLAHRYIGPDAVFPPGPDRPAGYRILITPTKVLGNGPWTS
jgi:PPOX class probable F420-dependent enzyme